MACSELLQRVDRVTICRLGATDKLMLVSGAGSLSRALSTPGAGRTQRPSLSPSFRPSVRPSFSLSPPLSPSLQCVCVCVCVYKCVWRHTAVKSLTTPLKNKSYLPINKYISCRKSTQWNESAYNSVKKGEETSGRRRRKSKNRW